MSAQKRKTSMVSKIMTEADLLQRDVALLAAVIQHGPIGIVRLSEKTTLPQHKVRYSLRMLQQDGLIEPSPEGATATEKLRTLLPQIRTEVVECVDVMKNINKLIDSMPVQ